MRYFLVHVAIRVKNTQIHSSIVMEAEHYPNIHKIQRSFLTKGLTEVVADVQILGIQEIRTEQDYLDYFKME